MLDEEYEMLLNFILDIIEDGVLDGAPSALKRAIEVVRSSSGEEGIYSEQYDAVS